MPYHTPEFDRILIDIKPFIDTNKHMIIAVTGGMLNGKTTFSRFLSWYFNIPLIETDFYLIPGEKTTIDQSKIFPLISRAEMMNRPIIVDGFQVLVALKKLNQTPRIIITAINEKYLDKSVYHDPAESDFNEVPYFELNQSFIP